MQKVYLFVGIVGSTTCPKGVSSECRIVSKSVNDEETIHYESGGEEEGAQVVRDEEGKCQRFGLKLLWRKRKSIFSSTLEQRVWS
jgi:hypothetical protein